MIKIKNYNDLIKIANHLLEQIQHADRCLNRMEKKQLNVSVNILDLSKKLTLAMPEILKDLEERNIAKVNHKKLKQIYQ
jgi:uncharacterized protein YtpQ (UPF0354 family)